MTVYKTLSADDKVSTKTLLHEAIPITGTIVSGTYGTFPDEENIENFSVMTQKIINQMLNDAEHMDLLLIHFQLLYLF